MDARTAAAYDAQAAAWIERRRPQWLEDGRFDAFAARLPDAAHRAPGVPLVRADLHALPLARASLDGAWAVNCYQHLSLRELPVAIGGRPNWFWHWLPLRRAGPASSTGPSLSDSARACRMGGMEARPGLVPGSDFKSGGGLGNGSTAGSIPVRFRQRPRRPNDEEDPDEPAPAFP